MPNTIEDKISLFTKIIIERIELDYKKRQKKLLEYYENRKKSIINDYEEQKRNALERTTKEAETEKQQLILKNRSAMHLAVLKKKKEFTERVTEEVKRKICAFVKTEAYEQFLTEAINQVLSRFPKDQWICIHFSNEDLRNRQDVIFKSIRSVRAEDTYRIEASEHLIGGIFVKSGDGRMEIDFTVNTILEESDKLIGEVLSSRLNQEH